MNKPEIDPSLPFEQKLKAWYDYLDTFISTEEKNKTSTDVIGLGNRGKQNHYRTDRRSFQGKIRGPATDQNPTPGSKPQGKERRPSQTSKSQSL